MIGNTSCILAPHLDLLLYFDLIVFKSKINFMFPEFIYPSYYHTQELILSKMEPNPDEHLIHNDLISLQLVDLIGLQFGQQYQCLLFNVN